MIVPEPIVLSEIILSIGASVSRVYKLAKNVKDAKNDIKTLCDELFALKGVLEHVRAQLQADDDVGNPSGDSSGPEDQASPFFKTREFGDMLEATRGFLQDLLKGLERPKSHLKSAMQSLAWPFTKAEVQDHIARLERVKSWFIFAMITDGVSVLSVFVVNAYT